MAAKATTLSEDFLSGNLTPEPTVLPRQFSGISPHQHSMRVVFIFALLPLVLGQEYRLFHRIYHPLNPQPVAFSERATVTLSGTNVAQLVTPDNVPNDLEEFAEVAHSLDGAFYQLALQREGDEHEGHWAKSSVKAVRPQFQSVTNETPNSTLAVSSTQEHIRDHHFASRCDRQTVLHRLLCLTNTR